MSRFAWAAVAAVCVVAAEPISAIAEEPLTPGGDVTANEAAVLPPVVVSSPNEAIGQRARPKRNLQTVKAKSTGKAQTTTAGASGGDSASEDGGEGAIAGYGGPAIGVGAFTLGQMDMIGGSTITNEAMWTFNKKSLSQAVNVLPGVSSAPTGAPSANSSGSRNEGDIYVRGFNRYQVPLSIDGVRVYLPADNRIDMNRFLTDDLAEVQIAKGYVSVLNGPGAMGGAINLVSRKPVKEIGLEGRAGIVVDSDVRDMNSWNAYAYAGTRQKGWYAQISGNIVDQDHFNLSHDFRPANSWTLGYDNGKALGFDYEDGGNRDHSDFRDWRINTKIGITPNATDEYSINYTNQQGEKGAPLSVNRQIVQGYFNPGSYNTGEDKPPSISADGGNTVRYWDWPQWDTSSLSWLSKTTLGDSSYIKTNAFYNTFQNAITFYKDATYTAPYVDSPYDDYSYGGFVEMGTDLIPMNTLKGAIHYRHDAHNEMDTQYGYVPDKNDPTNVVTLHGDPKRQAEETWSFAVENTFHATRFLDLVAGVSYDMNEVVYTLPETEKPWVDAWNWQTAAIYSYSQTGKVHADVSSRTRFPTLFDRFSTRFGSKVADPDIPPERATNYEIGFEDTFGRTLHVASSVFYSDIEDSIQNTYIAANSKTSIIGYSADGYNYGFEISADWDVTRRVRVGGNYTYLERHLDLKDAAQRLDISGGGDVATYGPAAIEATEIEGTPRHKAFIYASWKASDRLTLTPSVEIAADRTALVTSCASTLVDIGGNPPADPNAAYKTNSTNGNCGKKDPDSFTHKPNYINIGAYALLNFQAEYAFDDRTTLSIGAMNLLDQNYSLADGFPEPGRQFFATLRARF